MCWLQPQILKHITALRPERKKIKFLSGCLGDQKFWLHNYTLRGSEMLKTFLHCIFLYGIRNSVSSPLLFGESEILTPLLCCLGDQKFWISCVVWQSEVLNPLLCCLGDQKFWISWVVWQSEVLNPLLCCLGNQKFWILFCVIWGIRNSESSVLFGGPESSPVLVGGGGQKFWILSCVNWGISSPVLFGGQKFWILSSVLEGSEILYPLPCCLGEN